MIIAAVYFTASLLLSIGVGFVLETEDDFDEVPS